MWGKELAVSFENQGKEPQPVFFSEAEHHPPVCALEPGRCLSVMLLMDAVLRKNTCGPMAEEQHPL